MSDHRIQIYTDGSVYPNPNGMGGWGVVLISPNKILELYGGVPNSTNNRMELTAAIEALKALKRPCIIDLYTDSEYLQKGITEWIDRWIAKGWRKVANPDLWQELHTLTLDHIITWHWVRGHVGNKYNERADELALQGRLEISQQWKEWNPDAQS